MHQKSTEVAAPSKQHVAVSLEYPSLHQDATVTEVVSLALLVQFPQQLGQVARHFHAGGLAQQVCGKIRWLD